MSNDGAITRETLYGTHPEPTFGGVLSFLRRKYTRDLTGVDIAVTGVPFDAATTNRPGARFGPRAIRAASARMAWAHLAPDDDQPAQKLVFVQEIQQPDLYNSSMFTMRSLPTRFWK